MTKVPLMSYDEGNGDEPVQIGNVDMSLILKDGEVTLVAGELELLGFGFPIPRSPVSIPAITASSKKWWRR